MGELGIMRDYCEDLDEVKDYLEDIANLRIQAHRGHHASQSGHKGTGTVEIKVQVAVLGWHPMK